ncbi:hypothetical protein SAMN05421759_11829 [Roseivivax lentus]|uniref:Nuclease homologue n=1 Tax=Roseivivax lentus TaxID=633194 RepID=A0A1N7PP69_9RHOB|nr:hypothetical protein [Roseivivax lentus]SIT12444.1 hypothetical protein SAMN05421759_11829 [Roseivivax lentus]
MGPTHRPVARTDAPGPTVQSAGEVKINRGPALERATATRGAPRMLAGRVSHVRDGDTIEVAGTPVRLGDLDCAELGSADGARARRAMVSLADGAHVTCALDGRRSYDREIGRCRLVGGPDLARAMRDRGICGG